MMMIQLFREAQKGLLILRMGVSMNGELCTPARLALHKVVEGRSGDQFGASVVSIDDHRSCIGRKNRMSARWGTKPSIPANRFSANRLAGGQSVGRSTSTLS